MARKAIRLVGAHEIRMMLGGNLSRQRVYQLMRRDGFPVPYGDLKQGKVWLTDEVETWIATHRRKPIPRPSAED